MPRTGRRRTRDEDEEPDEDEDMYEEDDDEEDDEEEEKPARRRRTTRRTRAVEEDDEDDGSDDDADEDVKPTRRRRKTPPKTTTSRKVSGGREAYERLKKATSKYPERVTLTDEEILLKFIEDAPFISYAQHWVGGGSGRSFTCRRSIEGEECPLCDIGRPAAERAAWNVVDLSEASPKVKMLEVPGIDADFLFELNDGRKGPLTKDYVEAKATGKKKSMRRHFTKVKTDELDDWNLTPLSEADLKGFRKNANTSEFLDVPSFKELKSLANKILRADDGDDEDED